MLLSILLVRTLLKRWWHRSLSSLYGYGFMTWCFMARDRTNVISDFKICYNRIHVGTLHFSGHCWGGWNVSYRGKQQSVLTVLFCFPLTQVANLACSISNNEEGVKLVRMSASQLEALCPQVTKSTRLAQVVWASGPAPYTVLAFGVPLWTCLPAELGVFLNAESKSNASKLRNLELLHRKSLVMRMNLRLFFT